jgi:hypothetical protein
MLLKSEALEVKDFTTSQSYEDADEEDSVQNIDNLLSDSKSEQKGKPKKG